MRKLAFHGNVARRTPACAGPPETSEGTSYGNAALAVHGKTFAWERPLRPADVAALGPSAPSGFILGVRTDGLERIAAGVLSAAAKGDAVLSSARMYEAAYFLGEDAAPDRAATRASQ